MSVCTVCKLEKDDADFCVDRRRPKGIASDCRSCRNSKRNRRKDRLSQKYGMSEKDYDLQNEMQDSRCAICKKKYNKLHVDHCHISGLLRGLLCSNCNTGLGQFADNIDFLQNAIDYLINNGVWQVPVNKPEPIPHYNSIKIVCSKGHLLSGANLRIYKWNGREQRRCRECINQGERDKYWKKKSLTNQPA